MSSKGRTGLNPLAYLGVDPVSPPSFVLEGRDPTLNDYKNYEIGTLWLTEGVTKLSMLINKDPSDSDKWIEIYPGTGGSGASTFPCDVGTALEIGGILNIRGSDDISVTGAGNYVTIGLENDVTIVSSLTVTPIISSVMVTDATGLVYGQQGSDLEVFAGNTGAVPTFQGLVSEDASITIAAGSVAGTINLQSVGSGGFGGLKADDGNTAVPALNVVTVAGDGGPIGTTASGSTLTVAISNGSNGQVLIGGGTTPAWATLTSSDSSIIFTPGVNQLDMVAVGGGGSTGVTKLGADSGTAALPTLGEVDILGGTNIVTVTNPSLHAVVVHLDDWIALPATNAAATAGGISLAGDRFMHAIGTRNTFLGKESGKLSLTTATDSVGIGSYALGANMEAKFCTAVGSYALGTATQTNTDDNTSIGYSSMYELNTSGINYAKENTAAGSYALGVLKTGNLNTCLGYSSGYNYTGNESNNICLGGNVYGELGESNTIHIGVDGAYRQTNTYISGIYGASADDLEHKEQRFVLCEETSEKVYGELPAKGSSNGSILSTKTNVYGNKEACWASIVDSATVTVSADASTGNISLTAAGSGGGTSYAFAVIDLSYSFATSGDHVLGETQVLTARFSDATTYYAGDGAGNAATFTAQQAGKYYFAVQNLSGYSGTLDLSFIKGDLNYWNIETINTTSGANNKYYARYVVYLAESEVLKFKAYYSSTGNQYINIYGWYLGA